MNEEFKSLPLTQMRRLIAAPMVEAKRDIPHFRLSTEIEVDPLISLREQLRASKPAEKLSLNDLIIKACAGALLEEPGVNAQWAETEIRQMADADISVVTAVEGGVS